METMNVTKILTSVFAMYFQVLSDSTKFHYHQMEGEEVIKNQNFQFFLDLSQID